MMPNLRLTDFCESLKGQGKKLLLDTKHNNEFADRVCAKEDRRKLSWQTSHRHLHSLERQPEGVQVVEGVGLVASGF